MPEKSLDERIKEQKERQLALEKKIEKANQEKEDALYLKEIKEKTEVENADNLENIYLLSEAKLNELMLIKIKAKKVALVAYQTGKYDLYKDYSLVATIDEEGLVELDDEYKVMENIPDYMKGSALEISELDPEELKEQSKEDGKTDLKEVEEKEKEEEEKEETVDKLKEDTGLEILSLVRIEDERFSEDIVGYQTGYSEQYVALTKDGTFHLIGEKADGTFEEHPDFLGASSARPGEQPEYDEHGNCCGNSTVDLVMRRSDGKESLGIDMSFGSITLTNIDTNEPIATSNYTPTQSEIDERQLADAKGRQLLLEKEKEEEEKKKAKKREEEKKKDEGAQGDDEEDHGWPGERKAPGEI